MIIETSTVGEEAGLDGAVLGSYKLAGEQGGHEALDVLRILDSAGAGHGLGNESRAAQPITCPAPPVNQAGLAAVALEDPGIGEEINAAQLESDLGVPTFGLSPLS